MVGVGRKNNVYHKFESLKGGNLHLRLTFSKLLRGGEGGSVDM